MTTQQMELEQLQAVTLDAGEVFSGKSSGRPVMGYAKPSAFSPRVDPGYIFHESTRDLIVWFLGAEDALYVVGPTGCGKTTAVKQIAARLNYPTWELTGHGRLEFADLVGHLAVRDGNMVYEYGPLSLAMRYGGMLLINEIDLTPPEICAGLNSVLDGSPLCVAENGGEIIQPHPQFRLVVTANTSGMGDETGLYQGTQRQNLAWLDRFMLVEMVYPDRKTELKLLADRFPAIPVEVRKHMVSLAREIRKQFMGNGDAATNTLEVTMSTRSLLRWASLTMRFQPLAAQGIVPIRYALDRALTFRACRESRAAIMEMLERHFPSKPPEENIDTTNTDASDDASELHGNDALNYVRTRIAKASLSNTPSIQLRKPTQGATGPGSKDWIGSASTAGVDIRFGRTGMVNQLRTINRNSCRGQNPMQELEHRALGKIGEGYVLITAGSHI